MSSAKSGRTRQRLAQVRAVQQHQERRRRMLTVVITSVIAALVLAGLGYGIFTGRQPVSAASAQAGPPPWPAPANPQPAIKAAGLTAGPMGTAEHYHAHLDVYVDGRAIPVAANIGIDPGTGAMTALHTHDNSGVLHIEAAIKGDTYTLGQLFTEWGVKLTADQLGALKTGGGKTLTAYLNGGKTDGDPATIVLKPHLQIALVYGKPDPSFVPPATYQFQPGE